MIDIGCSLQSVLATLCYNLGPLPQHTLIGSCPGDPDNGALRCLAIFGKRCALVIGVPGTSPAMTSVTVELIYPTSPVIGRTALLSGNTAAASASSSSRR
jgi:hypothetical protein